MAADCVIALCRQPALAMPMSVKLGDLRLELPVCAIHADEVSAEFDYLKRQAREAFYDG